MDRLFGAKFRGGILLIHRQDMTRFVGDISPGVRGQGAFNSGRGSATTNRNVWGASVVNWFQDPWVVGIGGGIVSGLVVFFLTKWLFSNQGKRELGRKIAVANQEIVLAVRQGIPENTVPAPEVLEALIKATARKHALRAKELYGPAEVAQDLIKEVMDSSFISADTKEAYCKRLAELDKTLDEPETEKVKNEALRWSTYRSSQTVFLSMALGITAAAMSATMVLFVTRNNVEALNIETPALLGSVVLPVLVTLLGATATMAIATVERLRRQRKHDNMMFMTAAQHSEGAAKYRIKVAETLRKPT